MKIDGKYCWRVAAVGVFIFQLQGCAGAQLDFTKSKEARPNINRQIASEKVKPIKEVREPAPPKKSGEYDKVAVVQWAPSMSAPIGVTKQEAEEFKQGNRETLAEYIREAAANGAKLVVTPEFAVLGYPDIPELPDEEDEYRNHDDIRPYVEKVPGGESTKFFSKLAKELGVYLHIGFAEVEGDPKNNKFYNVVVAIDDKGKVIGKYHKINLFELENEFLLPGEDIFTYDSPWGKMGIIVCADVYSSFPMDEYKRVGVDVLALSTSWAQMNSGMGMFKDGAKRVGAYMLAANQNYFPDSGVINPDGTNQSHIRQSDGVAYGYLPRK